MKRLFALVLILVAVLPVGCGEDATKPISVFIPDGLMIDSPEGTKYHYFIIHNENDPPEDDTIGINVQGETFIELGFYLVVIFRDPGPEGNVSVTWAQGDAQIEEIRPGDVCGHFYAAEEYPTIHILCDNKGFSRTLE